MTAPTQRLYLEDARHKTALALVTGHAAGGFTLDRTVFHASDARYHHTHGPLPPVGAKAQLHLDAPRRDLQARAHTLAHLTLAALAQMRCECVSQPEVVGGGEIRFAAELRNASPSDVEARVSALVATRAPVVASWAPRDDIAKRVTPQAVAIASIAPEEPTLRVVRIGESALPCDAPLVERSSDVGALRWAAPLVRDGVTRMRARVDRKRP